MTIRRKSSRFRRPPRTTRQSKNRPDRPRVGWRADREDAMSLTRRWRGKSRAVGPVAAAAFLGLLVAPTGAQTPGGIPGVVAPAAKPELAQGGYVFTGGPVGTADGGFYSPDTGENRIFFL